MKTRTKGKSSPPRLWGNAAAALVAPALLALILGGCSAPSPTPAHNPAMGTQDRWDAELSDPSNPESASLQSQAHEVFAAPTNTDGVLETPSQAAQSRWTILMTKVDTSHPELLAQMLAALKKTFPETYLTKRSGETFIAHGQYTDPRSRKAKADLKKIHDYTITLGTQTAHTYASAFMAPPSSETLQGNNPARDLRNARKRFGPTALYTLQIAIYGHNDRTSPTPDQLVSFRRTAEQAVISLRSAGEQAFYYHGPARSTVTIGIFYEEDHDPTTYPRLESTRLKAARERHPLNLLNGQGITQIVRDERGNRVRKPQPSFLVTIPKK